MLSDKSKIQRIIHKGQKYVYSFRNQGRTYFGQEAEIVTRKYSRGFLIIKFL